MKQLLSLAFVAISLPAAAKPMKVVILADQSNMQGHAKILGGIGKGLAEALAGLEKD